jgi:NTP pyrophosphatase (non-canonical NTP hydrolase)
MFANDYQNWTIDTAIYPEAGTGSDMELYYLSLGLCSEAGEVAGKVKKYIRDDKLDIGGLAYEISDVCWYVARLADALGYDFEDILEINFNKLNKRKDANTLSGSGDER